MSKQIGKWRSIILLLHIIAWAIGQARCERERREKRRVIVTGGTVLRISCKVSRIFNHVSDERGDMVKTKNTISIFLRGAREILASILGLLSLLKFFSNSTFRTQNSSFGGPTLP